MMLLQKSRLAHSSNAPVNQNPKLDKNVIELKINAIFKLPRTQSDTWNILRCKEPLPLELINIWPNLAQIASMLQTLQKIMMNHNIKLDSTKCVCKCLCSKNNKLKIVANNGE